METIDNIMFVRAQAHIWIAIMWEGRIVIS